VAVQVLVFHAAHLAPDAVRGRVAGNVMSGPMLGIMLARPAAGLITKCLEEWRTRDDSNVRPLPSEGNALSS